MSYVCAQTEPGLYALSVPGLPVPFHFAGPLTVEAFGRSEALRPLYELVAASLIPEELLRKTYAGVSGNSGWFRQRAERAAENYREALASPSAPEIPFRSVLAAAIIEAAVQSPGQSSEIALRRQSQVRLLSQGAGDLADMHHLAEVLDRSGAVAGPRLAEFALPMTLGSAVLEAQARLHREGVLRLFDFVKTRTRVRLQGPDGALYLRFRVSSCSSALADVVPDEHLDALLHLLRIPGAQYARALVDCGFAHASAYATLGPAAPSIFGPVLTLRPTPEQPDTDLHWSLEMMFAAYRELIPGGEEVVGRAMLDVGEVPLSEFLRGSLGEPVWLTGGTLLLDFNHRVLSASFVPLQTVLQVPAAADWVETSPSPSLHRGTLRFDDPGQPYCRAQLGPPLAPCRVAWGGGNPQSLVDWQAMVPKVTEVLSATGLASMARCCAEASARLRSAAAIQAVLETYVRID